jgi:hypothetical protein
MRVVMLSWLIAFAGCGRREFVDGEVSVIPGTDTVVTRAAVTADSAYAPRAWTPPRNDCRYTDARPREGDPEYWQPYDSATMARGVEYRCDLRPSGPRVRLVIRGERSVPLAVDVHSPPDAARPLQRLELENDERARKGNDLVVGEDLNGDGWTDLRMRTFSGTGGVMYDVYLYAPARSAFVRDTLLSGEGNVRRLAGSPCAEASWRMGGDRSKAAYCWRAGRWVLTRETYQQWDSAGYYIRTHTERRRDSMQIVRVDTLDGADSVSP